jgi:hypothetical protein
VQLVRSKEGAAIKGLAKNLSKKQPLAVMKPARSAIKK